MNQELEKLLAFWTSGSDTEQRILATIATLCVVAAARWLLLLLVNRRVQEPRGRYVWRKTTAYVAVIIGLLLTGRIWFHGFSDIATFLGLLSAGIAVALKDWITNFFGWIFIVVRRPFTIGDRIQISDVAGDVIDIRIFSFTLLEIGNWVKADQSTGRVIHVPNGKVMTSELMNSSMGFPYIWDEIPVLITFESNWRDAKEILSEIVGEVAGEIVDAARRHIQNASKKWLIYYRNVTPIVYTTVRDSGVELTMRFLTTPRARRGRQEKIWEAILERFGERPDIDFAYPTWRMFNNAREADPSLRPAPIGES